MLNAMRTLALDYLFRETTDDDPPADLDEWYRQYRMASPKTIFPYLVEDTGAIEKVFVIEKDGDAASLHAEEMRPEIRSCLPFVKPPWSRFCWMRPNVRISDRTGKSVPFISRCMRAAVFLTRFSTG